MWVISGFVTSLATSKVVNKSGSDRAVDIVVGVTGAVIGGWVADGWGEGTSFASGAAALPVESLLAATICAIAALVTYHVLCRVAPRDAHLD
jgi:uncharacterized membrane protein YeaQ/YmgE (transglycosylase-associated protein family)